MAAFRAVALQTTTYAVNSLGLEEARATIDGAIDRIGKQIAAAIQWHGADTRLIVLPEYSLTGFPMGDTIEGWAAKGALDPDGPEYDKLASIAQKHRIWLSSNHYETDRHFPGLYFQGCVVHGPTGEVVLRYRRMHSMYSPSPFDVWDRYLEIYGIDGVLPVAKTEIGNLAALASEEILYPELARSLALRGAEIFVHNTSEATSPLATTKEIGRRARAVENLAYVVSANSAGIRDIPIGGDSTNGHSEIVDHQGRVLAQAAAGESLVACAELDVEVIRRERARPAMGNLLARTKASLWASEYARHDISRPNGLVDNPAERSYFQRRQVEAIERLRDAGVLG